MPSILWSAPVPPAAKHPHNILLPPRASQLEWCSSACKLPPFSIKHNDGHYGQTVVFLVHPWEQFPKAWRYHVHLYKQRYASINTMGPHSHHFSGRRHVLSPRDERTLVRKVQINPRTTAKDLVKMLEKTGTKVSISTVKQVLYQHNLKGPSGLLLHYWGAFQVMSI